jgi:aldehyde:ferredoxin oxidoreductase
MDNLEVWRNTEDITGDLDLDLRVFAAVTGVEKTHQELEKVAERAFTLERAMLARAGRDRKMEEAVLAPHFKLPCRADGTLIDEEGFSGLLGEYYSARGWDLALGWPQIQGLKELGLEDVIPEIEANRQNQ